VYETAYVLDGGMRTDMISRHTVAAGLRSLARLHRWAPP